MSEKVRSSEEIGEIRDGARNYIFWLDNNVRSRIPYDDQRQQHTVSAEINRINGMVVSYGAKPVDPHTVAEELLREAREKNSQGWLNGKQTRFGRNS